MDLFNCAIIYSHDVGNSFFKIHEMFKNVLILFDISPKSMKNNGLLGYILGFGATILPTLEVQVIFRV